MRVRSTILGSLMIFSLLISTAAFAEPVPAAGAPTNTAAAADPLLQLLIAKGVLNGDEAKSLVGTPAEQRAKLLALLRQKGILSASDYEALATPSASSQVDSNLVASTTPILPAAVTQGAALTTSTSQQAPAPKPPAVIPAAAPVRVLPVGAPKVGGLIPALKLGPVGVAPYGFFKMSESYDTSNPYGNDFPLPGFIGTDAGPNNSPEFKLKARQFRFGANFEWPDISKKLALTGRIEADFEGDFTKVANRNVSSLRSSQVSLRLAFMRMDYHATPETSVFAEFGQDWSLFGSSILSNEVESTIASVGFGNLYEREAQIKFGAFHKLGGSHDFAIAPEFAIAVPGTGQTPADVANQLSYGERIGGDSQKPTLESRLVLQFQADKARGVAPAQIVFSGMYGWEKALVTRTAIQALASSPTADLVKANYPLGASAESKRWGWQGGFSIPTRYATFVTSYYRGGNMRWFFENQLYSEYNSVPAGTAGVLTMPDIDGAYTVAFLPTGFLAPVVPVRAQGGLAEIILPLSRIAHANLEGRNAGWTMVFHYGYDGALARDVRSSSLTRAGGRGISDKGLWNIQYKLNRFVTFAQEESYSRTRSFASATGVFPNFNEGLPSRQWHDFRSEFFSIFTF